MRKGMRRAIILGATVSALVVTQVFGATNLGETFTPVETFGGPGAFVQTDSPTDNYTMPSDGVITSWRYQATAQASDPIRLHILRSAGGLDYTTVGQSQLENVVTDALNSYATRVPVKAGDLLGIFYTDPDETPSFNDAGAGYDTVFFEGTPSVTDTYETYPGGKIDVAATLEPDADGDGYGDETQDCRANDAAATTDCVGPQTKLTKTPPNRLDRSKATFKFTSSEAGSTFKCKIDRKPYKHCTSPKKVKRLDEGKHKFKVRATDASGNVDASPAKDRFKVVD